MRLLLAVLLTFAVAAPAAAAATPPVAPLPDARVGALDGTRAYVAVSLHDGRVRVYVCDGEGRRAPTIAAWLKGRWDGTTPLVLRSGGVVVTLAPLAPDGSISGTVRAFSGPHPFRVVLASGPAGLYDGVAGKRGLRLSTIVLADRSSRGAIVATRPPKRVCRLTTVTLADGSRQEQTVCFNT
jgi:hypothetical protein